MVALYRETHGHRGRACFLYLCFLAHHLIVPLHLLQKISRLSPSWTVSLQTVSQNKLSSLLNHLPRVFYRKQCKVDLYTRIKENSREIWVPMLTDADNAFSFSVLNVCLPFSLIQEPSKPSLSGRSSKVRTLEINTTVSQFPSYDTWSQSCI